MNSVTIERLPALGYACAEAFNTLCTNLTFSGEHVRKILITSTFAHEGKSFVSMNIARTLAKLGKTVVLVDADLRRSAISGDYSLKFYDGYNYGLAHMLAGMAAENDVIYKTNLDNVWLVPVGRTVSNSLPLLNSPRFGAFLDNLANTVDYVIVDTPPLGTIIDAAQIAKYCDGSLITVGYNTVRRQELISVKAQLEQTGCPVLGTVLNQVDLDSYVSRKYYNKAYYAKDESPLSNKHGEGKKKRDKHGK